MIKRKKIFLIAFSFLLIFWFFSKTLVFSQTATPTETPAETPTPTPDTSDLQNKIKQYEQKLSELRGQDRTLSSQIAVMDNQIKLTQLRIDSIKAEIKNLEEDIGTASKKISGLEKSLQNITKALLNRIVATYQVGSVKPIEVLLTSNSISSFFTRASYLRVVQAHDKKLVYETQQAKNDYSNQKDIFEDKKVEVESLKKRLESYTDQINQEKKGKQTLLAETQGSEANYQRLLNQARAQLESFSQFAIRQGGASLLSNQTQCDDWGCYYNQRDSSWGGTSLNGTQYTLASDGCLVTAMAMIYTHYGHRNVTPATINGISSNFASYYPAYLKYSITADGASSNRQSTDIDSVLASGHPVVVGISYDGGSIADHFVVFVSGSNGNYIMNDPFTPNGKNISFRDRYPTERIVEIDKVVF